ncbi:MAG: cell division protein FtsA [Patescibacteria group bacterium]
MSREKNITAIDLGTDKCVTLIATLSPEDRKPNVVGVSVVPSKGMRKSVIVDLEKVVATISESLDAAERMAGFDVKSAYVSVSGSHVNSRNSKGVVAVAAPDQEITPMDVERVIEAARAISLPNDQEIIHVIPRDFKVDSQEGIKDPVGMTGVRLESEAHIVTGSTTSLKNLEKCINDLGLQVDSFVFSGLAAAEVALTETEKELGVVLVDLGAGSTSICAFVDGSLEYSGSIPIGARHITQDIALGCRISLESAEKIKLALSEDFYQPVKPHPGESKEDLQKRRKKADELNLAKLGVQETVEIMSKRTLVEGIMTPRMKEIIEMVAEKLRDNNLLDKVPAGVVITGGGAETARLIETARRALNLPARIGSANDLSGLVGDISKPLFATSVGLVMYGQNVGGGHTSQKENPFLSALKHIKVGGVFDKITDLFKSILP